jgi:hypothetical protein
LGNVYLEDQLVGRITLRYILGNLYVVRNVSDARLCYERRRTLGFAALMLMVLPHRKFARSSSVLLNPRNYRCGGWVASNSICS